MIVIRLAAIMIGYLIGTFQTGYFYGKLHGIDIREHGSGNSGTTNTLRTLGWKAGVITFLGDSLKAVLAVVLVRILFRNQYPDSIKLIELYAGFGSVLGHNFPFFLKFKGGKGIACTAGVMTAVCPLAVPVCCGTFILLVVLTRYVSLGSIVMMLLFLIQLTLFNHNDVISLSTAYKIEFDILAACFTLMAIWRHRENIRRLLNGTENKLGQKAK